MSKPVVIEVLQRLVLGDIPSTMPITRPDSINTLGAWRTFLGDLGMQRNLWSLFLSLSPCADDPSRFLIPEGASPAAKICRDMVLHLIKQLHEMLATLSKYLVLLGGHNWERVAAFLRLATLHLGGWAQLNTLQEALISQLWGVLSAINTKLDIMGAHRTSHWVLGGAIPSPVGTESFWLCVALLHGESLTARRFDLYLTHRRRESIRLDSKYYDATIESAMSTQPEYYNTMLEFLDW